MVLKFKINFNHFNYLDSPCFLSVAYVVEIHILKINETPVHATQNIFKKLKKY